jgi:hypothetical protein
VLVGPLHLLLAVGARDVPERLLVGLDVLHAAAHREEVGLLVEAERAVLDVGEDDLRRGLAARAATAGH